MTFKNDRISYLSEIVCLPVYQDGINFHRSRASNSEVNNSTWPKFKLGQDFISVLDTSKFKEVPIKIKVVRPGQHFPYYENNSKRVPSRAEITFKMRNIGHTSKFRLRL